ncbi:carotenoid oxygenase family protein [Desulforamulus aeronauticus]|uniref:Carotenoid cleavage dioxygenase n=1 Tax=Desulforamulus aeronauticus DSM 10349 TaxID=1121421 RepID=A0A1M6P4J5_9FIRM|nr:carotenoid oxygenase family protein [Desulforamulus aeronauticus]SHK02848.1 Carotenoid cleavage dioxygenase [Desulforamulus aeronauticus DSM 10349]
MLDIALGFSTLEDELEDQILPVTGQIPHWLTGTLIRNGAAKFEVEKEKYQHWFDGLAMLHKFSFQQGKISYTNKFLRGRTFTKAMAAGRIVYPEFATMPRRSRLGKIYLNASQQFTDNASVNVTRTAGRFLALTETPPRVEFDPGTLRTIGRFNYDDNLNGQLTTVHPHYDYTNQEEINYITRFSLRSSYNIYRIKHGSITRQLVASVPVMFASYMHSFAITENYIILSQFPLKINHFKLLATGTPLVQNLQWQPEQGTVFLVVNKKNGQIQGRYQAEAFFAFHHINAFEIEGGLVVDLVAYRDASIMEGLYLKKLKEKKGTLPTAEIRRYTIQFTSKYADYRLLSHEYTEFPRINYRHYNTKEYRFVYGLCDHHSNGFNNKLIKFDVQKNKSLSWYKDHQYPNEPIFVPSPDATEEDDGVILSLILDTQLEKSFLLILNAQDFNEIARAQIPLAIPFNSHGQYFA